MEYRPWTVLGTIMGALLLLAFAQVFAAHAQSAGPTYLYVEGRPEPLIVGQEYQLNFNGGRDGENISLAADIEFKSHSLACTQKPFELLCPSGSYTATFVADFATNDIYLGFMLYDVNGEDRIKIDSTAVPIVEKDQITPFRVKVVSLDKETAFLDISVINTTQKAFSEGITIFHYQPGSAEDSTITMGVLIQPGEIKVYHAKFPMEGRGTHIFVFRANGALSYPLGSDVYFPYETVEVHIPFAANN